MQVGSVYDTIILYLYIRRIIMDYLALAQLLFPDVTGTPEDIEAQFPARDLPEGAVVSRAAPSPTGFVHLGNLVQGLT